MSPIYIETQESVNLTNEMMEEAERIENDPEKILALIDLLFLNDDSRVIPS